MHLLPLLPLLPLLSASLAASLCPIYGPVFPSSKSLVTSPAFNKALSNLREQINHAFETGESSKGLVSTNDTYSIQIFSVSDEEAIFDYHHEGTNLSNSAPINGDSVYRIGSTTKLLTVYLLLLEAGDKILQDPITHYLPELKGKDSWDQITAGALASHLGGISADRKRCTMHSHELLTNCP